MVDYVGFCASTQPTKAIVLNQPPTKWIVYEQILRIPYYFVFNRYTNELKAFALMMNRYQALKSEQIGFWLSEAKIGLGLWQGSYQGVERLWLRWYDEQGNWIATPTEQEKQRAEQEKQRAEQEKQRAEQEKQRAEQEKQRAEQEKQRAEQEKQRAEQEKQRADKVEIENQRLRELLQQAAIEIPKE